MQIEFIPYIFIMAGLLGGLFAWVFWTPPGEIWRLKRRARHVIKRLNEYMDGSDCGHNMLREIYPEFRKLETELETIMDRCRMIDPEAPQKE